MYEDDLNSIAHETFCWRKKHTPNASAKNEYEPCQNNAGVSGFAIRKNRAGLAKRCMIKQRLSHRKSVTPMDLRSSANKLLCHIVGNFGWRSVGRIAFSPDGGKTIRNGINATVDFRIIGIFDMA